MKYLKNKLLLIGLLALSAAGMAQTPFTFNVSHNQCYTYPDSVPNGFSLDSVQVIQAPANGTLSNTPAPFTYCPIPNFTGTDVATVYACISGGTFVTCDTFTLTFNVQAICSLQVTLVQDSSAVCTGGNRAFTAVPTRGTGGYTYQWSDNSTTATACEINPGQGNCVTVTDGNGCQANACTSINGCNLACTINYDVSVSGILYASVSGGTTPYTYAWSNNEVTPVISNLVPGTYCVTVYDANNCSATACYSLVSTGGCYFSSNLTPTGIVHFASSIDSGYTPTGFLWSFSDGTTDAGSNPLHTFTAPGYYQVTMDVKYTNGDSCSYTNYVYIPNDSLNTPLCQAAFYNYIDSAGAFHFLDYSAYNPVSWQWDFGDGTSSANQSPVHAYNALGSWNVCLTITDASGCSSSYCEQVSNVPVQDVVAYLYHHTSINPGFPVWVYLGHYNAGTVLTSGTLVYKYPAGTTVQATGATPAAHDVANRLLTFNYTNLWPGNSNYINIELKADSTLALGSLASDTLWINPVTGDATPTDNVSVVADTVSGSWDPNDKAVAPKGEGAYGVVPVNTKELSYRIRFQNTGTAAAQTVKIRDVINNNIDLTSLKVTNASHAHTTEIVGNELVVTFANINLPDSGADYDASQGFIDVHVNLKPGLGNGTQIFNTANIYFDFNAPVITNTVVTTLGSVISGIESAVKFDFALMPNPANNQVLLRGDFEKASAYELLNQLGQVVLSGPVNSTNTLVDVSSLNSGIYLVRVKSGVQTGVQRLMIAK